MASAEPTIRRFFYLQKEGGNKHGYDDKKWITIEVEIDEDLKRQVEELISPMGLTLERLLQMLLDWLVSLSTEEAVSWLLKAKAEDDAR